MRSDSVEWWLLSRQSYGSIHSPIFCHLITKTREREREVKKRNCKLIVRKFRDLTRTRHRCSASRKAKYYVKKYFVKCCIYNTWVMANWKRLKVSSCIQLLSRLTKNFIPSYRHSVMPYFCFIRFLNQNAYRTNSFSHSNAYRVRSPIYSGPSTVHSWIC